jgi:rSAM/selenodomain-associated transferase 1
MLGMAEPAANVALCGSSAQRQTGEFKDHGLAPTRPSAQAALAIFARAPVPGQAKTRLIPLLGARGSAELQQALIYDALAKARRLRSIKHYLFLSGSHRVLKLKDSSWAAVCKRQQGRDLGVRLARAFAWLLRFHPAAVVIGTDSPLLQPSALRRAFRELRRCDAVLGPCPDGGYYLIGLRRAFAIRSRLKALFRGVRWSTRLALRDTQANLSRLGLAWALLPPEEDLDNRRDWQRLCRKMQNSQQAQRLAPETWRFVRRQTLKTIPRGKMRGAPADASAAAWSPRARTAS